MKKITLAEAYEFAIRKWQWIVANDGQENEEELYSDIPEISDFTAGCSYCELFTYPNPACRGCPLNCFNFNAQTSEEDWACNEAPHPFKEWVAKETKENAQRVLDLILKTKLKMEKFNTNQIVSIKVLNQKPVNAFRFSKGYKFLWWEKKPGMYAYFGLFDETIDKKYYIENNVCFIKPRIAICFSDGIHYIKYFQKDELNLCIEEAEKIMELKDKWISFLDEDFQKI